MRNSIFIITLFLSTTLFAQVDSPGDIYWDDPIYEDFFNMSCTPQNIEKSTTTRTITKWFMNDTRWKDEPYGNCTTIGAEGCYLTCIAMMLTNTFDYITPVDLELFAYDNWYLTPKNCLVIAGSLINNRPDPNNPSPTLRENGRHKNGVPEIEK